MSQNENPNTPVGEEPKTPSNGLLGEILSTTETQSPTVDILTDSFIPENEIKDVSTSSSVNPVSSTTPGSAVKKPLKKGMSTDMFLRIVGAIILVASIFFGAFLSYIVFNPGQAGFFISFGINPGDIARLLKQLVSSMFGVVTFILSVVWIVFLFQAILTKKEYKKKKTISIILSFFFGILLFSEITLWAFLVQKINATDYENPNGGVVVYDNEKLISERFKDNALMNNFDNLIGPIELKFDLKSDANFVGKMINIENYKINFDGAKCQQGNSSIVEGVNPQDDKSIICIFDEARVYKPTGVYEGLDRVTRKPKVIPINFHTVQIIGVVDVKKTKTSFTYDASRLISLGKINWYTEKNGDTPVSVEKIVSITMEKDEQVLCLRVLSETACDKLFIIPKGSSGVVAKIVHEQDQVNPFLYTFHIEDAVVKNAEITGYKWIVDRTTVCTEEVCEINFIKYRDVEMTLILSDSAGGTTELKDNFSILQPMQLINGGDGKTTYSPSLLKIKDTTGKSLIENTYNRSIKAYLISDAIAPMIVGFDATDVKVENIGYELDKVEWDFNEDRVFEKIGFKTEYELIEGKRYTFIVRYTFLNREKGITIPIEEKIIFEPEKKDIAINLKLTQDSEYAPTIVHVDGSASTPKIGTIIKFIYDFGEGKGAIEGDAIQNYQYNFPGTYIITFTTIRDDGIKESTSRKIVLKDTPKRIVLNTSVSSGMVGKPIDFDINGTVGQIDSYNWEFGDGNTSMEANPTHTYLSSGKFVIKINIIYADGTMKSADKEIVIVE
ncbi:PKD domain-containing protein [Candidatus Gracilibacteria bacterium]|nr:PKD domain-containing protein [Candidatus Gracilibacteria bacterium]OIO76681.1 MAG: hypothetical protein AUJ87_02155 [Candidatus Gracilibacteria bacterium CG1_02_38_174]PIQ11964.1 MAG: hypothetical protein COW68_01270 [Candidatus Gracilibacteria bacterium CG18_big_fil_WC_8_21_14_2_50_38_16]PIQ41626.1 MAG: hypothetical protein COW06_02375 [Candidatus Gracilibacteria bacterium CG12_big_fil_rev_8_21_14_0_65_38_15]PIZ01492.1 MAG: hypothetical protein COY60_03275 [Candidatus Gracilibacteria bacte